MSSLSNSRWQNRKERPNRNIKNGDMVDIARLDARECESRHLSNYREAELLKYDI